MKTILVTGANGQLGNSIRRLAAGYPQYAFVFTDVDTLDICDAQAVNAFVKEKQVDYIINCAAYTAVDKAEDDEALCLRINRDAVRNLGEAARMAGARVIHVSTDYVFDGEGTRPWEPEDERHPLNVYGQTKLDGELAVSSTLDKYFIVRIAWVFGKNGKNFIKTMLNVAKTHDKLTVVSDQIGTPTYAEDLAKAIVKIMANDDRVEHEGIYHYSNAGVCSWYDFAVEIVRLSGLNCRVNPVTTAEYPTKTHRPAYSVLDKTKIKHTFGVEVPEWQEALRRMMGEISGEQRKEKI